MSAFPSTIIRLIPLLGSPVDDEALNAVRALDKTLKSAGLDFHTVAAVLERSAPTAHHDSKRGFDWMELAAWCRDNNFGRLSARESYFVNGMCNWRGEPTRKQLDWLWGIARKLERAA